MPKVCSPVPLTWAKKRSNEYHNSSLYSSLSSPYCHFFVFCPKGNPCSIASSPPFSPLHLTTYSITSRSYSKSADTARSVVKANAVLYINKGSCNGRCRVCQNNWRAAFLDDSRWCSQSHSSKPCKFRKAILVRILIWNDTVRTLILDIFFRKVRWYLGLSLWNVVDAFCFAGTECFFSSCFTDSSREEPHAQERCASVSPLFRWALRSPFLVTRCEGSMSVAILISVVLEDTSCSSSEAIARAKISAAPAAFLFISNFLA